MLVDGLLYAGSRDGWIYAVDAATGEVRWQHDAKTKIFAAPAITGDELLLAGFDGTLIALNRRSHRETARTRLPGALTSTPVVAGDVVVIGCRDYTLYGLNRADLSIAWKFSFWFSWVESTPVLVDGTLYIGGSDFARVTALDPATGRARWSAEVGGMSWGTPLVTTDAVYAGTSAQSSAILSHTGGITAIDRSTGRVRWRHELPLAAGAERAGYLGSLAQADNFLIGAAFDGTVTAYPMTPAQ